MSEQNHNNEEVEYIFITNEDGVEQKFEILYESPPNEETGYTYLLLVPFMDDEDEQEGIDVEVYPIRYKTGQDEQVYETLETDEEWEMVEEILRSIEEATDFDEDIKDS